MKRELGQMGPLKMGLVDPFSGIGGPWSQFPKSLVFKFYKKIKYESITLVFFTYSICLTCLSSLFPKTFSFSICDALCDLLLFVQFKKREKHTWRIVALSSKNILNKYIFFCENEIL